MKFDWPSVLFTEDEWNVYVRAKVPALAQLWDAGKYEQYNTMLSLYQLTYENFQDYIWNQVPSPYIPMPMQAPTGKIFKLK